MAIQLIIRLVTWTNSLIETKDLFKSAIIHKLNQDKETSLSFINRMTHLNCKEVSNQENLGFAKKGFIIIEASSKRIF